jgi:hypothetical protein
VLGLFFYPSGIVHVEFISEGATVSKEILHRLCSSVCRKRPGLWLRKKWLLLHDMCKCM